MRVVSGTVKGTLLKTPRGKRIRPTSEKVKAAFFNIVFERISDASFLDLFAGTGSIGIEALSRGAKRCTFVDKSSYSISLLKQNVSITNFDNRSIVLKCEAFRALTILSREKKLFDIIYIDPPYNFKEEKIIKILWDLANYNLAVNDGIIGLERDGKSSIFWLEDSPFKLRDKKTYGDISLTILQPR